MIERQSPARYFIADAVTGAGIFVLGAIMMGGTRSFAATFALADPVNLALSEPQMKEQSMLVLGIVFSLLFAFNAAFFRHLGRAYSGPSRRRGR